MIIVRFFHKIKNRSKYGPQVQLYIQSVRFTSECDFYVLKIDVFEGLMLQL